MKPARFNYWEPGSVDDLTSILSDHAGDAKVLAGGQSLMPVLNMRLARVEQLVDINRLRALSHIRHDKDEIRIGALVRHHELMESPVVADNLPLLKAALPYIGHAAIRYRGTLGGSLAHADPSAELPAVALNLGAKIELTSKGRIRSIPAEEFFVTYFTTALQPDEVVTEVRIPVQRGQVSVVRELARRHGDFALAGIVATLSVTGGRTESARLTAFGVDEVPRRLTEAEALLSGEEPSAELIEEAEQRAVQTVEPETDMHASAEYRRRATGTLLGRALKQAYADAGAEI